MIFLFSLSIFLRMTYPQNSFGQLCGNNTIKNLSTPCVKTTLPLYKPYTYQMVPPKGNFFTGIDFFLSTETGYSYHTTKNSLVKYSLKSLKYIGYIQNDKIIQALLLCPDGQVEIVKEGDRVGKHKGSIVQIRHDSLRVKEFQTKSMQRQSKITIVPFVGQHKGKR